MNTQELQVQDFIDHLQSLNVQLAVNGDKLKINAPPGVLTDDLKEKLRTHKPEIIRHLQPSQQPQTKSPSNLSNGHKDEAKNDKNGNKRQIAKALLSAIPPLDRETAKLTPSYGQYRMWFLSQLQPETPSVYHLYRFLRMRGEVNYDALRRALDEIVARHEVIRTNLVTNVLGNLEQVILPPSPIELVIEDLSDLDPAHREGLSYRILKKDASRPFNLQTDILLRGTLLRLTEDEHVLQLTTHHVASDRWSLGLLTQEFTALYRTFVLGQESPLPELPIQYADFAVWQREWLAGDLLKSQLTYWQKHLSGAPPVLALPTDHSRPPYISFRGAWQLFTVNQSLTDELKALGRETGATLYMTLLSAFYVLLHRYTQQQDIVVGTAIANRQNTQLEKLIGYFANTLALRVDLSGNPSFREVIAQVKQITLDAYAHQDTPFEQLVEELQPERNLSYSPIFQTMFIMLNTPKSAHELTTVDELQIQEERIPHDASQFDVTFFVGEGKDGLDGVCEYSTDLFELSTIERMIGHYQSLLTGIVANPDTQIAALPLLTPTEKVNLLENWNQTERDYPEDQFVCQLFEAQVERTPDHIAASFADQQLSYRELNARANQLAHKLRSLGVGAEVFVGVCLERSLDMLIALLGTLKAGGVYVPIDPAYPKDRVDYMLENSEAKVVLTQDSLVAQFSTAQLDVVALDRDWSTDIAQQPTTNPQQTIVHRDQLAYVIYTSGSTGKPKGVLIPHGGLSNFLLSMQEYFQLDRQDKLVAVTTISFDIAALELYLPLITGAEVVIASREVAIDGNQLSQLIEKVGATIMQATPATWYMLLSLGWQPKIPLKILCGGEPLPPKLAEELQPICRELWNMYGPTETTIWSSNCQVKGGQKIITVGKPIANTQFHILDSNMQLVPVGVAGELYIGGAGLARGYHKRPDLTAEKFVENPLNPAQSPRLYRTGDLARWLPNGEVECLGRADFQVKIRGFRIELGEIESALVKHPQIEKAIVVARESEGFGLKLVAYAIATEASTIGMAEMSKFLKETLPDYMVPSAFVRLEEFPLTPNGKVDRKALPSPNFTREVLENAFTPPRNEVEKVIANIWSQALKIEQVGIHDNFFDLGGNSLLAVRVFSEIEKVLNKKIPLNLIFQHPTIAALSDFSTSESKNDNFSALVSLQPLGNKTPIFCTHAIGTSVQFYRQLVEYLGKEHPFYGLQSRFLQQSEKNENITLEDMAGFYIQEIQTIQPKGPYLLGGFSFGGIVVYEMAQQLLNSGHEVALLAIFDTSAPDARQRLDYQKQLLKHWHNFRDFGIDYAQKKALNQIKFRTLQAKTLLKQRLHAIKKVENIDIKSEKTKKEDIQAYFEARLKRIEKLHLKTLNEYVFKPYGGELTLFRSLVRPDNTSDVWDETLGWSNLVTGKLKILDIPGSHHQIFDEPYVQTLAEKMSLCLEEVNQTKN
jgi:amino acid adenylation domain-containing protein